eukprot:TRINITY_DN7695_c0_g3_i7.p1 TRINITY_DN7695_c0_g3~~TRINITY_DN7695_c0_g3_i7.p1  ORF type:complete len:201 (-),score=53.56 TRINITY_DN7695_c0_g3_i7:344-874(-)
MSVVGISLSLDLGGGNTQTTAEETRMSENRDEEWLDYSTCTRKPDDVDQNSQWSHHYSGHYNSSSTTALAYMGPDSDYVVSGSHGGRVFVWDALTTKLLNILTPSGIGDKGTVRSLISHPSNMTVASCSSNLIRLWSPTATLPSSEVEMNKAVQQNKLQEETGTSSAPIFINIIQF